MNLKRAQIPEALSRAAADPYATAGTQTCAAIVAEVVQLDAILGPDVDAPPATGRDEKTAAAVLRAGVGILVPFRGLVRQITGAADHDEQVEAAISGGFARRGFLRGRAAGMNCPVPGRLEETATATAADPDHPWSVPGWTSDPGRTVFTVD